MLSEQLSGNFSQQDISESETNARSANPNTSTRSLRFVGVGYSFDLSAVFVAKVFVECLEIVKLLTRLLKGGRNGLFLQRVVSIYRESLSILTLSQNILTLSQNI